MQLESSKDIREDEPDKQQQHRTENYAGCNVKKKDVRERGEEGREQLDTE